jgi:hypothetical protein
MAIDVCMTALATALCLSGCASSGGTGEPPASAALSRDPVCLTQTGSRIPVVPGQCMATGRSYSSAEIGRTGATSSAKALSELDPAITGHN